MGRLEKLFVNSASHSRRVAARAERLLRLVEVEPGQHLLDVGCGNGAAALRAARALGLRVTGVDVDPEQIEAAHAAAHDLVDARFLVADATALPFPDGEFDLVITNKVTHHIADWPAALAEMVRVLRPGGCLVYGDLVVPRALAAITSALTGGRVSAPTRAQLQRLFRELGLEPVRVAGSPVHLTGVFRKPDRPRGRSKAQ